MPIDVPPPDGPLPGRWAQDESARRENRDWADERKLREAKTSAEILWAKSYGWAMIAFLAVFSLLFLGSLSAWSLHYLLPVKFHWLSSDQLSKVQSVIFSGSLGGVVSFVAQKQLSK
ncbi:MAG: hypothetical protein ACPGNV_12450 [Mangrovicoccus sp.]